MNKNPYRLSNKEVVLILKEALSAMEVKNYNIFKVRAYQNALAILDNLTVSIYDMWENKRLDEIPGVGESIQSHLNELFTTGKVEEFIKIKQGLPQGMFALIGIRGIGAKKAFKLALNFKLVNRDTAIEDLKKYASEGKIANLEGFGEKSQSQILESIDQLKMTKNEKTRMLYYKAEEIVQRIEDYMKKCKEVLSIEACGSYRRKNPTIGDLDFPVSTNNPKVVMEHFLSFPEIDEVLVKGDKKASVVLKNDFQVDLRVCDPKSYGSMLQYFTGSKQHNILLRNYALDIGMSLSEYGIKVGDRLFEYESEQDFYKKLNLSYIPPELRHGNIEIERSKDNLIPQLIELSDIKGDIHSHTTDSDGENTLEEMVEKAISLGYEYYGISDHAPSVTSRGYKEVEKIIEEKRERINKINKSQNKTKVYFGYEVNILADCTLGLPDELLSKLDYVIASIHTSFDQTKEEITQRLIKAIQNPYVNIIGHPSGRLLNQRDPIDPDWDKVFMEARDNNKILEINSQPSRLDLPDDLIKNAIDWKVKLIINTDAHSTDQMDYMKYGIFNARRGWATKENIINTKDITSIIKRV